VIQEERTSRLNANDHRIGDYILYWMQSSVRAHYNHALEYAIDLANRQNKPLVVCFGLTEKYPGANLRHYKFLIEGLIDAQKSLAKRGVNLIVRIGSPPKIAYVLAEDASLTVVDTGYTRIQKIWRRKVAERIGCPLIQVETNIIVPIKEVSSKEEYSAYTLRRKITPKLSRYMVSLKPRKVQNTTSPSFDSLDLSNPEKILNMLNIDRSVKPVKGLIGGNSNAVTALDQFIQKKLDEYQENRNDPTLNATSKLSPYLHFGQISPLYIALMIGETRSPSKEAFLEELIVRRELAVNFSNYNPFYDSFDCLPNWCIKTLREHEHDPREYIYSLKEFEAAQTHDAFWNAAQNEMVKTGSMHGYMRMYWGKKILEWSPSPKEAYKTALYLNDKYQLDGRDANGYAGVAWCFGKHDRPWKERPIFGKMRYMNARGLKSKFDADLYAHQMSEL